MITQDMIANWVGSDNLTIDELLGLVADIVNGNYLPNELKKDILDYANLLEESNEDRCL